MYSLSNSLDILPVIDGQITDKIMSIGYTYFLVDKFKR